MKEISNKKKGIRLIAARLAVLIMTLGMLLSSMPFELLSYANETDNAQPAAEQSSDAGAQTQEKPKADTAQAETPKEEPKADSAQAETPKEEPKTASDDGVLEVSSEAGSYTVDFYYTPEDGKPTEFHLKGGSEIMMSELFKKLGIERDAASIKETVFTDNELVKFIREGDDYRIVSLKPFNTEESLTITFEDGEVIVLRVEDAVVQSGYSGAVKWEIDDAGVLTLKPDTREGISNPGRLGENTSQDSPTWKWYQYNNLIKEIKVEPGVYTQANAVALFGSTAANPYPNLKKVDLSGLDISRANQLQRMFSNVKNIEEIDLSVMANKNAKNLYNINNLFNGCTNLKKVNLDGLTTRVAGVSGASNGCTMTGVFTGCNNLEEVDLSNVTLGGRNDGADGVQQWFMNKTKLTDVKMENAKFPGMQRFDSMFEGCTALTEIDMSNVDVSDARYMTNMFKDCSGLKTLDVSGFGQLEDIVNMNGFVNGCTGLKVLNIDNLDNSVIGPTNTRHSVSEADSQITGAREYGRMLDIHTCTALEKLSAKSSKVWMVKNNRGLPGNEYYNAAETNNIYYFTEYAMIFDADVSASDVEIDSDRDYIDLITDRDGTNVYTTSPPQDPLPDAGKNINIVNGDLNRNGAGFLAPGVYTIKDTKRKEPDEAPMCDTYYRIAYVGEVPYKVEGIDDSDDELVLVEGSDNTYINTKNMTWPQNGNYVIDRSSKPIKITYEEAAIDMNGKKYDVQITVTKITFKGLDKIPTDPGVDRVPHDGNKYVPSDRTYYRPILQANMSDGLQFHNYVWTGDPEEPWNKVNCLGKGSGTDIDFKIEIVGAPDDTSFVFKGEDLDVAASQNWINSTADACYDKLPIGNNTYGTGGESFVLGSGNQLSTVRFAEHTGLALVEGNKVVSTGSDPDTTWSEFTVKADAKGANYTWASGISCTTHALRNTKSQNAGAIKLQPVVLKELLNGTLSAEQFEFELKETSKDPITAPSSTNNNQTKNNAADGKVAFDKMEYKPQEKDGYFPGQSKVTYTYTVSEKIPDDAQSISGYKVKDNIIYDETQHTITVVISPPENETEMIRGIKAEIYVDKTPSAGVNPDKTYWHHEKACVDCSNGSLQNIDADKWYDADGNSISDPNPIAFSGVKFRNKVIRTTLNIPTQKILQGRPWKETDKFATGLVLVSNGAPMPANTVTIGDGHEVSEVVIDSTDTPVKNEDDKVIGYKDAFGSITYTMDDAGKTYEYTVRELTPAESSVGPIPGVTYDTESYTVKVRITLDTSDSDDPKLVATPTYTGKDGATTIPSFTNVYDAQETDYKMEAVKDFYDITKGEEIGLEGGEFTFAVKPIGENAAIAPMPAGYEGSGADRRYYKTNESDGDIEFEGHPDQIKDGMVFNYKALLEAGVDDAALHSVKGVDFEYEIYEIIPGSPEGIARGKTLTSKETLVNNEDGTYSVIGDDYEIVYDGVHHTRKITVKVIAGDATQTGETVTVGGVDYEVYKDFKGVEFYNKDGKSYKKSDNTLYAPDLETLDVEGHEDDHKSCYYISEKGGEAAEVPMSEVDGYDPSRHHFKVDEEGVEVKGAPIFINYRFDQKYVDLKVIKKWNDGNDSDKIRPNSITATITSDEGDYKPKDLVLKKNSWKASEKLPVWKFDIETESLKKINYSVKEAKVPEGYTVSYSPNPSSITLDPKKDEFALTITNSHTPETNPDDGDDDCPDCDNDGDKDKEGINGDGGRGKAAGVHTGDDTRAIVWMVLLAAALAAMIAVIIRRRRREQ